MNEQDKNNFSPECRYGDHGYPFGDRAYPYKDGGQADEYKGQPASGEDDAKSTPMNRYDVDGKAGAAEHTGQDKDGYGYGYGLGGNKPVV